ncbi:hypothetical protein [Thermosyntropha sp.]|uniref:Cas10/Cmr2 second palm domain-containing protein n=1 Tax=Thermosyntropha sp. TaxID=2740820 RepID=UPI0025F3F9FE|nr:hypothetical protein [Thermosyntropha sp.]MBO8159002.1 hypothetical protein [Thermosyntropha sp.]
MNDKLTAALIDTVSIQEYIFSSNKLRENIGASYIVENIYNIPLKEALEKLFGKQNVDIHKWEREPCNIVIEKEEADFEIGYIGGGNTLIFFKEADKAREFIKIYTKHLLATAPGLRTAFGLIEDFDLLSFQDSMLKLHKELQHNKNRYFPNVDINKYGFTLDCPRTNKSAELGRKDAESKFISAAVDAKVKASRHAKKYLEEKFFKKDVPYTFTYEITQLGQHLNLRNYIAVVHVDGNRMGEKFSKCGSLQEIRTLSKSVKSATENAFTKMVEKVVDKIEDQTISCQNDFHLRQEGGKTVLPLVPVVAAGDDVTFICEGRLGLWLAEVFIKEFSSKKVLGEYLSACGGVSIVKTKYPFYRAYNLAEGLTNRAKKESRKHNNSSFIDFFISSSGWNGEIDDIFQKHFTALEGNLHFGPYRIDAGGEKSVANLKNIIKGFYRFPKNKLMQLRAALFESKEAGSAVVEELRAKNLSLPKAGNYYENVDLWNNQTTPYFDAIELIDFYPEGLLCI